MHPGVGSGEREQTLNQLLIEMDGFHASSSGSQWPVLVIAATNRPEVLDKVRTQRLSRRICSQLGSQHGPSPRAFVGARLLIA